MEFIKDMHESRMTRSTGTLKSLTYTDCRERLYLSVLILEALYQYAYFRRTASEYARRTTGYDTFKAYRMSGTDLYNFAYFVNKLDKNLYFTDFDLLGSSNYAFNLILKEKNTSLINKLKKNLIKSGIEFRMGSAGGGNQLRQPYLSDIVGNTDYKKYPITEHVHFYGMYIGNYPSLKKIDIDFILKIVNLIK